MPESLALIFCCEFYEMFKSTFSQNSCEQLVLQKVDTCMIKCHFVFLINFKMKFYFYLNMENEIQIIYFNPCTKSIIPDFRAKQILKMKMKNEKLLKFVLFLNQKSNYTFDTRINLCTESIICFLI